MFKLGCNKIDENRAVASRRLEVGCARQTSWKKKSLQLKTKAREFDVSLAK